MSTQFSTVEEAKNYAAAMTGVPPDTFMEVPDLKVADMGSILLDDPETSETIKQSIRDRLSAQKGFEFKDEKGIKLQIVIGLCNLLVYYFRQLILHRGYRRR